jgi:nitroreductase
LCARDLCPQLDLETFQLLCQPDFNLFFGTTTLVLIGAKAMGKFTLAACWSAEENLMLAAQGIGLGTCVIGLAANALNMPDIKREFNIPPESVTIAPVIIGLPLGKNHALPFVANRNGVNPRPPD